MNTMTEKSTNWNALAGMRFLLAFVVFADHLSVFIPTNSLVRSLHPVAHHSSVWGFLLISGFSIRNSITLRPQGYLMRRFWRIWPVFLVGYVLAVLPFVSGKLFIQAPGVLAPRPTFEQFIGNLFMLQMNVVAVMPTYSPSWSLAIEELFYLCAFGFVLCSRGVIWCLIGGSLALAVIAPQFQPSLHVEQATPMRALILLCVWLVGWQFHHNRECVWAKAALVVVPMIALSYYDPHIPKPRLWWLPVIAPALLLINVDAVTLSKRTAAVARYLGESALPDPLASLLVPCGFGNHFAIAVLDAASFGFSRCLSRRR